MSIFNSNTEGNSRSYRIVKIPKGGRDYRTLYIPCSSYRALLEIHLPALHEIAQELDSTGANYAFVKGRNAALNAKCHIGKRYALKFDLKDFFDSISVSHVSGILPRDIIEDCFINGAPRQGLPTSPLIATIALYNFDADMVHALNSKSERRYTRYADDITISFDRPDFQGAIRAIVVSLVRKHGLALNSRKTKLLDARNGRLIISGIGVDQDGLHPTRKTVKKFRAAMHQGNLSSARGLAEWAACKLPTAYQDNNHD